jgi:hypothetical protein
MTWTPAAGATNQTLVAQPLNGSAARQAILSGTASSATDGLGGVNTCYAVLAAKNLTSLGNSDVLCGLPGISSSPAAAGTVPNLSQAAREAQSAARRPRGPIPG